MLTIEEALSLTTVIKPGKQDVQPVDLFHLDNMPIWREFLSGMRMALRRCKRSTLEIQEVGAHNIKLLHQALANTPNFRVAEKNALQSKPQDHHWFWQLLLNHPQIQAGIMTVFENQPVPLHDHPDGNGMIFVLHGKVRIHQYQLIQDLQEASSESDTVALRKISDRGLAMGEADVYLHDRGNIHGMRALSPKCIMLEIIIPPHEFKQRSWYLPTHSNQVNASHLFARQVVGEQLQNTKPVAI